jgi:hypothetical protein
MKQAENKKAEKKNKIKIRASCQESPAHDDYRPGNQN